MMIEKVTIQLGGGTREELAMLRMQEAKAKKPTGKAEDAKSQKPQSQKTTCRSRTGNAEDAKREEL